MLSAQVTAVRSVLERQVSRCSRLQRPRMNYETPTGASMAAESQLRKDTALSDCREEKVARIRFWAEERRFWAVPLPLSAQSQAAY